MSYLNETIQCLLGQEIDITEYDKRQKHVIKKMMDNSLKILQNNNRANFENP